MSKNHTYNASITWTGAGEDGTKNYKSYGREHTVSITGKPDIAASSDPAFRGAPDRHNPEDMLVAATASCHMLWYLHFCSVNKVQVLAYQDNAIGIMTEGNGEGGHFTAIHLRPQITISKDSDPEVAKKLHHNASKECFIANTLKCPVEHTPEILVIET